MMLLLANCLVKVLLTYELKTESNGALLWKNSNELLDSIKYREFLQVLSNISFFRMTMLHEVI
jgi:ferric iron reductase protein FhuF